VKLPRRRFLRLAAGAAAWPLPIRAQQPAMPVVGVLHIGLPPASPRFEYFRQGLRESDYLAGQNVGIEYRSAEGQSDHLPKLASDLVRRQVAVIAAVSGTNSALAAKAATTTIPIVFLTGGDPVTLGLVGSLNRPEANITGVTFLVEELGGKSIGLLHELVPDAKRVGVLVNPRNPALSQQTMNLQEAARALGLDLQLAKASEPNDLGEVFKGIVDRQISALLVGADPLFGSSVEQIVALAARYRIPTVYYRREFVDAGGLMSYGTSAYDAWRQVGNYVGRILKGAKPGDLPVMQSTKFELVINLKAARALGIEVPPKLSARADEVIE